MSIIREKHTKGFVMTLKNTAGHRIRDDFHKCMSFHLSKPKYDYHLFGGSITFLGAGLNCHYNSIRKENKHNDYNLSSESWTRKHQ